MNQNNYAENNEIIALFMGWTKGHPDKNEKRWSKDFFTKDTVRIETPLPFHHDWDHLIMVTKMIHDITENWDYTSEEREKFEEIFDIDYSFSDFMSGNIEGIYNRCVEFIKYYNGLSIN